MHLRGTACRNRHGSEFYAAIGKKGGTTTKARHGVQHFQKIGKLGGSGGVGSRVHKLVTRAEELRVAEEQARTDELAGE
jgi:general stress protein YciG